MDNKKYIDIILSFDLDNTLIDNREGIVSSFNYALNKFNLPELEKSEIELMIGIPLNKMFERYSNQDTSRLVSAFRSYYRREGIFRAKLLPGIKSKLKELNEFFFTLGIITSKKQEMAEKIIEILGIQDYFDYIIGETEETRDLGKLDPKIITFIKKNYSKYKIIIIGDHPKDVLLSNNLSCPFIGVLTGNHSAEQLKEIKRGKILIIDSVSDLSIENINSLVDET
ncbi:MAG: HAD family hydrolase [Candidatus Thorarchaeota archaeon]